MKLGGIGIPELLIILAVILLIFGPKNLPKLGSALGKTVKNLREGMESAPDIETEEESEPEPEPEPEPKPKKKRRKKPQIEEPKEEAASVEEAASAEDVEFEDVEEEAEEA